MAGLPLRNVILVLGLAAAMPAGAQLYKWTDANGRVQYSDRPPAHQQAKILGRSGAPVHTDTTYALPAEDGAEGEAQGEHAAKAPAAPTGDQAAQTWAEKEQAFRKRRMEAEEERQKQAKAEAEQRAKQEHCERNRNYLKTIEGGRRLTRTNSKGEMEFLDDAQRQAEAERTRQELSQHCS